MLQGLKKHYERDDVEIDGKTYKLRVNAVKTDSRSQKVVISNTCNARASNFVVIPVLMSYCMTLDPVIQGYTGYLDLQFMDTVAHEFGHEIVFVGEGIHESLTHKGSSNAFQQRLDNGPVADCSQTVTELEIMHYYKVKCLLA